MKRYLYTLLLLLLAICGAQAQEDVEIYDDAAQEDSLMADTFAVERHALPWEQTLRLHLDKLLEHDMFGTSQVALMVYDLDADSTLYAHNERQLMRPASTMKVLTAIAAIDLLEHLHQYLVAAIGLRPSFAIRARLPTAPLGVTYIAWVVSIRASTTTTCVPS